MSNELLSNVYVISNVAFKGNSVNTLHASGDHPRKLALFPGTQESLKFKMLAAVVISSLPLAQTPLSSITQFMESSINLLSLSVGPLSITRNTMLIPSMLLLNMALGHCLRETCTLRLLSIRLLHTLHRKNSRNPYSLSLDLALTRTMSEGKAVDFRQNLCELV
ncbi:hypothetical protein SERLADRAFT_399332 [Serpula lacrymans var. lacrymans S7.9]|uniref:Uncharacterized protein n=1 Tax=Serpula lacrymans var. lacrymans (strain S7.9) TaxID=578457 RepID=F8P7Q5_SERL9|nr:uncharacterized protein SERLADRAFT_399332 [Serpula lacrymans var. lacrymans S7.9]EGO20463.1 hypothetical protein SERLADRAFT_399332 [Serpula lacrymans var. lacrymans S7.9]